MAIVCQGSLVKLFTWTDSIVNNNDICGLIPMSSRMCESTPEISIHTSQDDGVDTIFAGWRLGRCFLGQRFMSVDNNSIFIQMVLISSIISAPEPSGICWILAITPKHFIFQSSSPAALNCHLWSIQRIEVVRWDKTLYIRSLARAKSFVRFSIVITFSRTSLVARILLPGCLGIQRRSVITNADIFWLNMRFLLIWFD